MRLLRGRGAPVPVKPLRTQIFEHVMPMTVLPIVFLGVGLARLFTVSEERQASRELAARAGIVGQRIAGYMERHEAAIRALAQHLGSHAERSSDQTLAMVRAHHARHDAVLTMFAAHPSGHVEVATSRIGPGKSIESAYRGYDVSDREYFREAMRTGNLARSAVLRGRGVGAEPIIVLAAPIMGAGGKVAGVAGGSLDLDRLSSFAGRLIENSSQSFMVVDAQGRVVASAGQHAAQLLADVSGSPWVKSTSAGGNLEYRERTGSRAESFPHRARRGAGARLDGASRARRARRAAADRALLQHHGELAGAHAGLRDRAGARRFVAGHALRSSSWSTPPARCRPIARCRRRSSPIARRPPKCARSRPTCRR